MKNFSISFIAALLMFFCASTVQAQNKSDQNSDVMIFHQWFEFSSVIDCPKTGPIYFEGKVQRILKRLPDGTWTNHYNAYGEGYDENGDLWKWHDAWIQKYDGSYVVRNFILQGPKGAKLQMRVLLVLNGNGEIVQYVFEPLCD